ncbi:hypothetical protein [uncultured Nostoc sp.]|nr:hypothetical protein [uncultured Nostoc sp.]
MTTAIKKQEINSDVYDGLRLRNSFITPHTQPDFSQQSRLLENYF